MASKALPAERRKPSPAAAEPSLPFETSVGYQIRMTHRAVQRYLQARIEPFGVTPGMWYFLRALWDEDGLTQRELSHRTGTTEPTALNAIAVMERAGFVTRRRNRDDGRKINVMLTSKGRQLKKLLLPFAIEVVDTATRDFSERDKRQFLRQLHLIQRNVAAAIANLEPADIDA